jgi:hypothetical protein
VKLQELLIIYFIAMITVVAYSSSLALTLLANGIYRKSTVGLPAPFLLPATLSTFETSLAVIIATIRAVLEGEYLEWSRSCEVEEGCKTNKKRMKRPGRPLGATAGRLFLEETPILYVDRRQNPPRRSSLN